MNRDEQLETISKICADYKGILAADESTGTIGKRLSAINLENTKENRIKYRDLLFTTPNLNRNISGVITFEETLLHVKENGEKLIQPLLDNDIVVGIKVDKGVRPLYGNDCGETVTQGIDNLAERCKQYYEAGARFAKWRAVLRISEFCPSELSVKSNAYTLARYASICQNNGLVPIVEPEILMDGDHSIEDSLDVTRGVLYSVYQELLIHNVDLTCTLLKPSFVRKGVSNTEDISYSQIGAYTIQAMEESIPQIMPGVVFLSGGLSCVEASIILNETNKFKKEFETTIRYTFSYGRALQQTVLQVWEGKDENIEKAQKELLKRARANGLASMGEYIDEEQIGESLHEENYVY